MAPDSKARLRVRPGRLVFLGCVVLAVGWLGSSWAAAWRLTRRASAPFAEPAPAVEWGKLEELRLTARDGVVVGAWLLRGTPSKPCVILIHGNGDSRRSCLGQIEALARKGYGVLALSLRAHGDSTGEVNDFGWSGRADIVAAVETLARELPGRKIAIWGQSLGAATAIFAAKELGARVSAYALESPYSDLKTAVRNRTSMYLPWGLDAIAYAGLVVFSDAVLPVPADEISPRSHVAEIPAAIPVLFLAGSKDRHTAFGEVEAMQAQVASHSRLVRFEGALHSRLWSGDRALYERSLLELLEKL